MLILYIYDETDTVSAQITEGITALGVTRLLNGTGQADFRISIENEYASSQFFKEWRRVRIGFLENNTEKTMFDGIIHVIEASLESIRIRLKEHPLILENRLILTDKTYTTQSVSSILQALIDETNARNDTGISLVSSVSDIVTKEYTEGDTLLSIIEDLSDLGYEWRFDGKVLTFETTVGIDRTQADDNFLEYRYDILDPRERSINKAGIVQNAENIVNFALARGVTTQTYSDTPSILEFWQIEDSFASSGEEANEAQTYVNDRKESIREYDITPKTYDFFEADVGDLVKVFINTGSDLLLIDSTLTVVEKKYTSGDLPRVDYKLSKGKISTPSFLKTIKTLKNKVQLLEIKQ